MKKSNSISPKPSSSKALPRSPRKVFGNAGFTLIELMIVVAIIGVLTAVLYPSYDYFIMKGNRSEAKSALNEVAATQEQYYLDVKTYAATMALLVLPTTTADGNYTIAIDAATAACPIVNCYSLTATPVGRQLDDVDCLNLSIDSRGLRSATGHLSTECW